MVEPIQIKILKHLYDIGAMDNDQIDITDFLITIWRKDDTSESRNDLNRIKTALHRLQKIDFIFYSYSPEGLTISEEKTRPVTGNKFLTSLGHYPEKDEISVKANITWKGYEYIVNELRKDKQEEISQGLKRNSTIQRNTAIAVGVVALASMILSATSVCNSRKNVQSINIFQDSLLHNSVDSILQYQRRQNIKVKMKMKDSNSIK